MFNPIDDTQNYHLSRLKLLFERLNTQLNDTTNQNSLKSPKLLSKRIGKRYYKTFGTSVNSLESLSNYTVIKSLLIILELGFYLHILRTFCQ